MSIWCSLPTIGFDDADEPEAPVGQVRSYANGWSNHYPSCGGTVEREAALDLAYIPSWCAGGHEDDESVGPWLRLGLRSSVHNFEAPAEVLGSAQADVVLDEDAVRALVGELTAWLERPKVAPDQVETPRG